MLAVFKQRHHHDLRRRPRRKADEPGVVLHLAAFRGAFQELVGGKLSRSRLAANFDIGQPRADAGAAFIDYGVHPVDRHALRSRDSGSIGPADPSYPDRAAVRMVPRTAHGYAADRAGKLYGGHRESALADGDGRRFAGIPFLALGANLPLLRWHEARSFVRKVDAGLFAQAHDVAVEREVVDAVLMPTL